MFVVSFCASDRLLIAIAEPSIFSVPAIFVSPFTSSLYDGEVVPTPTLPLLSTTNLFTPSPLSNLNSEGSLYAVVSVAPAVWFESSVRCVASVIAETVNISVPIFIESPVFNSVSKCVFVPVTSALSAFTDTVPDSDVDRFPFSVNCADDEVVPIPTLPYDLIPYNHSH